MFSRLKWKIEDKKYEMLEKKYKPKKMSRKEKAQAKYDLAKWIQLQNGLNLTSDKKSLDPSDRLMHQIRVPKKDGVSAFIIKFGDPVIDVFDEATKKKIPNKTKRDEIAIGMQIDDAWAYEHANDYGFGLDREQFAAKGPIDFVPNVGFPDFNTEISDFNTEIPEVFSSQNAASYPDMGEMSADDKANNLWFMLARQKDQGKTDPSFSINVEEQGDIKNYRFSLDPDTESLLLEDTETGRFVTDDPYLFAQFLDRHIPSDMVLEMMA